MARCTEPSHILDVQKASLVWSDQELWHSCPPEKRKGFYSAHGRVLQVNNTQSPCSAVIIRFLQAGASAAAAPMAVRRLRLRRSLWNITGASGQPVWVPSRVVRAPEDTTMRT